MPNIGYATDAADQPLAPRTFERPAVGPRDVQIEIAYCGICHSDVHQCRDEWGGDLATNYPCMPGHEIAGTVTAVGDQVTRHAVGDRVGVGCFIWSCRECDACKEGLEQYCESDQGVTFTYNAPDPDTGEVTFGGYSDGIVVDERFVLAIPDAFTLEEAAPLLCAGITTYSPLKYWKAGPGKRVGVAGIGGLGHIAIQIAKGLGAEVVALTRTEEKAGDAKELGADDVLLMSDDGAVEGAAESLDLVLSTIPTAFDVEPYLGLLRRDGTFASVGCLEPLGEGSVNMATLSLGRRKIAGSLVGGLPETQEMLDFCAELGIKPQIKVISADEINDAFDQVNDAAVRYRFVIDADTIRAKAPAA